MKRTLGALVAALAFGAAIAHAQQHDHASHGQAAPSPEAPASTPTQAGQSAYAALAEIVGILEADPATDWSRVDLERVRQHLIDMNEVVLNARVTQTNIDGGFEAVVTGGGRTAEAIRRMARAHARQVESERPYRVAVTDVDGGSRVRVTVAEAGTGSRDVAKLRALGFIGLLTLGDHHGPHHLMMARGSGGAHH